MNTHPSGDFLPSDSVADFGFAAHGTEPFGQSPYDTYDAYGSGGHQAAGYAQYPGAGYDWGAQPDVDPLSGAAPGVQGWFPATDPYADPYGVAPYGTDAYGSPAYATAINGPYDSDGYGTYAAYGTQDVGTAHHTHFSTGYDADPTWDGSGFLAEHPDHIHLQGTIPRQYSPTDHAPTDLGFDAAPGTDAPSHWSQGAQWEQGEHWGHWDTGGWDTSGYAAYGHPVHPQDTATAPFVDYDNVGHGNIGYDNTAYVQGFWHPDAYGVAGSEAAAYGSMAEAPGEPYAQDPYAPFPPQEQQPPFQQAAFQQLPEQSAFSVEQGQYLYGDSTFEQYSAATGTYGGPAYEAYEADPPATVDGNGPLYPSPVPQGAYEAQGAYEPLEAYEEAEPETESAAPGPDLRHEADPEPGAAAVSPETECRGRRRSPKRRSALMTVAAPSVAVLGVAGIAAASVSTTDSPSESDTDSPAQASAADSQSVKHSPANNKLDTQLAGLSEDADDFADRASRTQERIDLKKRKEAERKRKAAEAARKEAMRPKFVEPVSGSGISAQYGQAGVNWMSLHSGIDFPVSYGTAVKAATDGTVTTKYDASFGNMIIVTAEDGTETWYCHLSSTKIRSGTVKAGDVIAYSGNSGNSTGPHLHFEVHPGGGSAIDPLPWFRSHGVEPG